MDDRPIPEDATHVLPHLASVLQREKKDLGFMVGTEESQKKKNKNAGPKVQQRKCRGAPLLDSSVLATLRQVGIDINKLPGI